MLELALHRYDEEYNRNKSVDDKNQSMGAFLAVMLTIQSTVLIRLMELDGIINATEMNWAIILFIISFAFSSLSLFVFISSLTLLEKLYSSPKIDNLVYFGQNNIPLENIVDNTILSLNNAVLKNNKILNEKRSLENVAFLFLSVGLIVTTIVIMYMLLIIIWV